MSRAAHGAGTPTAPGAAGRGRAAVVLAGVAVLAGLLLIGLGFAVSGLVSGPAPAPTGAGSDSAAGADPGGDPVARAERELVVAPMLALPAQASLPQPLSSAGAGPALVLPRAQVVAGQPVPGGFPATAEGALAQVVALTRAGVDGGDPDVYDAAYAAVSEPGAPAPWSSHLHVQLAELRAHGGLRRTGPVPGLVITWTPTGGLIKGSTSGGSLVVGCVLGQLDVDYRGRVASAGLGDCQAMRRVGGQWRIAAGPAAAVAPSAWPGSDDAVAAGYRELR